MCVFLGKWIQLHVCHVIQLYNVLHLTGHLLMPWYKINLIPGLSVGFSGMNGLSHNKALAIFITIFLIYKRPVRQQSIITVLSHF